MIDRSKFDASNVELNPVKATLPILTCKQSSSEVEIVENTNFNVSVGIIDNNFKTSIPNINWNVSTFFLFIIKKFYEKNNLIQTNLNNYEEPYMDVNHRTALIRIP